MDTPQKKPTIKSLMNTICKLKSDHQRVVFKLNKKNEQLEANLSIMKKESVENQNNIEILRKEKKALLLQLEQFKSEPERNQNEKEKKECSREDDECEVEKILRDKIIKRKKYYLVRWKGYSSEHNSWVQKKDLLCPELLAEYEQLKQKK